MAYRKLGVKSAHRRALLRNATTSLIKNGKIDTTEQRAKEIASMTEKMITLGKEGGLNSSREALAFITREDVAKRTFEELSAKYKDRNGGYTRITRIGQRRGDAAEMAVIELV